MELAGARAPTSHFDKSAAFGYSELGRLGIRKMCIRFLGVAELKVSYCTASKSASLVFVFWEVVNRHGQCETHLSGFAVDSAR